MSDSTSAPRVSSLPPSHHKNWGNFQGLPYFTLYIISLVVWWLWLRGFRIQILNNVYHSLSRGEIWFFIAKALNQMWSSPESRFTHLEIHPTAYLLTQDQDLDRCLSLVIQRRDPILHSKTIESDAKESRNTVHTSWYQPTPNLFLIIFVTHSTAAAAAPFCIWAFYGRGLDGLGGHNNPARDCGRDRMAANTSSLTFLFTGNFVFRIMNGFFPPPQCVILASS